MTSRILPPAEWPRLAGTLLETAWPHFDPAKTSVLVCEDAGRILGCVAVVTAEHLDGVWIAPSHRQAVAVQRALLVGVRSLLRERGVREVLMMATTAHGARLIQRFGRAVYLACDHFSVLVGH